MKPFMALRFINGSSQILLSKLLRFSFTVQNVYMSLMTSTYWSFYLLAPLDGAFRKICASAPADTNPKLYQFKCSLSRIGRERRDPLPFQSWIPCHSGLWAFPTLIVKPTTKRSVPLFVGLFPEVRWEILTAVLVEQLHFWQLHDVVLVCTMTSVCFFCWMFFSPQIFAWPA